MTYRITDSLLASESVTRINTQRAKVALMQERVTSGKRINRPSDDPGGAELVLNLRTSQKEIAQFQRNASIGNQKLTAADDTLNTYEGILDRVRTLMAQGLSDTTSQSGKNAIATELDSLKARILSVANTRNGDEYLFGGIRQNVPPFDPTTGAPASATTRAQYIQIEPGVNAIPVGVTADTIFSDGTSTIFADLTAAVTALRGTGDAAADKVALQNTNGRLAIYADLANNARAIVGTNLNATKTADDSLSTLFQSMDERASNIEGADFAESSIALADAQRALEATLQTAAAGRKSLFDFLQ